MIKHFIFGLHTYGKHYKQNETLRVHNRKAYIAQLNEAGQLIACSGDWTWRI